MKNNKKINKIRRQRGYAFENYIVNQFNDMAGWSAKRLGSPSLHLPDVMCINNMYKTIIAIEAKSTVQDYAYVPQDQVERCIEWANQFALYDTKQVVLAFKFGQTIINNKRKPERRSLRYFYKIFPHKELPPTEVRIDYAGNIMRKNDDEWISERMEMLKI